MKSKLRAIKTTLLSSLATFLLLGVSHADIVLSLNGSGFGYPNGDFANPGAVTVTPGSYLTIDSTTSGGLTGYPGSFDATGDTLYEITAKLGSDTTTGTVPVTGNTASSFSIRLGNSSTDSEYVGNISTSAFNTSTFTTVTLDLSSAVAGGLDLSGLSNYSIYGNYGPGVLDLQVSNLSLVAPAPEPPTMLLLGVAGAMAMVVFRRRLVNGWNA